MLGPNGFVRRFTGNRITATSGGNANPEVTLTYAPETGAVSLAMRNDGGKACAITVTTNNSAGGPWRYELAPVSPHRTLSTPGRARGWYDLTATADTADRFTRRFAGHLETGTESITDPAIGSRDLSSTVVRSAAGAAREVRLDLGSARTVTGVRSRGSAGGSYELSFSLDGATWSTPRASAARAGMIPCAPTKARYVRLRSVSEMDVPEVTPVGW